MKSLLRITILAATVLSAIGAEARQHSAVDSASAAVQQLDYVRARQMLEGFIRQPVNATTDQLAQAHLLLGVIDYSENATAAARSNFVAALQLKPDLTPDPRVVSPKIVEFFEEVRASAGTRPAEPETVYVTLVDPRPAAALRSMALPGWGQFYKGQRTKALVAGTAWFATVGGALVANGAQRRARQRYVDETDPDVVADRYDSFDRMHKLRNTLAAAAGAVWLVSYIDALATPGRVAIGPLQVEATPRPDGLALRAVWTID